MDKNKRLTELRTKLGMTMEAFGERIGLSRQTISNIESGRRNVTDRMIMAICREFGVSEDWLESGSGEMFKTDTEEGQRLKELIDRHLSDSDDKFRAALLEVILQLNAEQVKAVKEYAAKYLLPALKEDVRPAAFPPDPAETLQKRSGLPEEPAQPAAKPAETLPEGSGLSEADEAEIRRKAQEYADMLREEKRAEGRSSSLNDGRLKKEA